MDHILAELGKHPVFSGGIALMVGGAIVAWARRLPLFIAGFIHRRLVFTVEVHDRDQSFAWFQAWLASRPEAQRARNVVARVSWSNSPALISSSSVPPSPYYHHGEPERAKVHLSPAPGTQVVHYRRYPIIVTRRRDQLNIQGQPGAFTESITLQFIGGGRANVEAMVAEVTAFAENKCTGVPVCIGDPNGGFRAAPSLPIRDPKSLALADGLYDDILADIRRFRESAQWYADRGVPYRRGYLLHGPPGTGKSTLAPVVAGQLGMGIGVISLGDPNLTDYGLRTIFDNAPPMTIVIMEDIDCVFRQREAASDKIGVTLSGLLNVLDGIGSREGRIIFLTTNHPERLDPALVRPGRIDRKIELGYATAGQASRMFRWFFSDHPLGPEYIGRLADRFASRLRPETAPAAIQEHLLRHRDDPADAVVSFGQIAYATLDHVLLMRGDAAQNGHTGYSRSGH